MVETDEEDIPATLLELLNYIIHFERCIPFLTSCLKIVVTLPSTTASSNEEFQYPLEGQRPECEHEVFATRVVGASGAR